MVLTLLFCCLPHLFILTACGKGSPAHGAVGETVNTARYTALPLPMPEGFSMLAGSGAAYRDRSTGVIYIAAQKHAENGPAERRVFFFTPDDHGLLSEPKIPGAEEYDFTACAFSHIYFWYVLSGGNGSRLCQMDLAGGMLETDSDLYDLPEMPPSFVVEKMAVDGDGDVWLAAGDTALVYTPELSFVGEVRAGGVIRSLAVDAERNVWACADDFGTVGYGAAAMKLDKLTGGYGEFIPLDPGTQNLAFSDDGALYYDTEDGIRRITTGVDGKKTDEAVMSFLASGIVHGEGGLNLMSGEGAVERSDLLLIAGDALLFASMKPEGNRLFFSPMLYSPAEDAALGEDGGTVTIQVAYAHDPGSTFNKKIIAFTSEHPDITVQTLNYTIYDDSAERLLIDITTGIIHPDIVIGGMDSLEIRTLARKERTLDLMPFLGEDDELNPENIFGCVLRYFDNGKGGLWGFTSSFSIDTWLSTKELLGPYANDGGWTLSEYLDFAETLPEGRFLSYDYGYRGMKSIFLPGVYESFADLENGECTFDSPLFVRYLKHLDSLPPYSEIREHMPDFREMRELYRTGLFATADAVISNASLLLEGYFASPDYVIVGYPSDNSVGRNQFACGVFVIMDNSEHPDEAWDFLRESYLIKEQRPEHSLLLKSDYDEQVEEMQGKIMIHLADGTWTTWHAQPEDAGQEEENIREFMDARHPGIPYTVEPPDEEQISRIRSWLDSTGGRALDLLPPEVNSLIREEISTFLGGVGTAEDCAKKIQSRVSIWMAEHQ